MYRIYIQNGLITGKETMHHLEPIVPDTWLEGITLPAVPVYENDILVGIREMEFIPYTISKNPITAAEEATITAIPDVTVIVDETEYPPEEDGIVTYANVNPGIYQIVLRKHGYKDTVVTVEVVEGA